MAFLKVEVIQENIIGQLSNISMNHNGKG